MKTKRILVCSTRSSFCDLYIRALLSSEGIVCISARIIHIFKFGTHIYGCGVCNCRASSWYHPSKFGQCFWTMMERPLYTLRNIYEVVKGKGGSDDQVMVSPLPIHFCGNSRSKNAMWKCWNRKSLGSLFYHQSEVILNG